MNRNEKMQALFHLYQTETAHKPATTREVIEWAVSQELLKLPKSDPYDTLAAQMASALGQEFDTHKGHRYRVNHAVRDADADGAQRTFWAIMGFAPHDHMLKAFKQRREHIVGECAQLKTDVAVYNDMNVGKIEPVQMVMDFREDLAERGVPD